MPARRIRILLWLSAAACLAGAGFALHLATRPVDVPVPEPDTTAVQTAGSETGPAVPTLAQFQALEGLNLQQRLYEPEPEAPPPPPPLRIELTGTIIEPGGNRAMFILPGGEYVMRQVGQHAGEAEILAIGSDRVTVRHHDREIELTVEEQQR